MIVVANWKQNKTLVDINEWFEGLNVYEFSPTEIVIAPSFHLIPEVYRKAQKFGSNMSVASQNISKHSTGAHTGEVGAEQLKGLVKYSIVGHSEGRANGESTKDVNNKVSQCVANKIIPLVCFSNFEEFSAIRKTESAIYCYEPIDAISSSGVGVPATVESVKKMKDETGLDSLIYGGSVDKNTVEAYLGEDLVSGFLVGSASLDPKKFSELINEIEKNLPS